MHCLRKFSVGEESSVCVERSFFHDYGGNSLMAARLGALISSQLRVDFRVTQLFRAQVCAYGWM